MKFLCGEREREKNGECLNLHRSVHTSDHTGLIWSDHRRCEMEIESEVDDEEGSKKTVRKYVLIMFWMVNLCKWKKNFHCFLSRLSLSLHPSPLWRRDSYRSSLTWEKKYVCSRERRWWIGEAMKARVCSVVAPHFFSLCTVFLFELSMQRVGGKSDYIKKIISWLVVLEREKKKRN